MPAAPIPSDEPQRLVALRALALTPSPEERFDRITRLVGTALDVPIALISLVEADRQWFKSCLGLDSTGTRRSESFCAYTILADDPLVVPDALLDPRFSDNRGVLHPPSIRFYAGFPLRAPGGERVGSLCAIDMRPRAIGPREIEVLRALAAIAEAELNNLSLSQAMARLVQQETRFRSLVEHSSDLIHSFDPDWRILYANPAWRLALGYSEADIAASLSFYQIVHPDFIPVSRDRYRRLLAGEFIAPFESRFLARDGRILDVEGNVSFSADDGQAGAVYGIYRDITARKALDAASRRARREAENAIRARSQFLANVSHEIRTPLHGILGMSSMLMLARLPEDQLRYARTIDSSGRVLLNLINQILDFSKLDAGAVHLERISFSLAKLIQEIVAVVSVNAAEKGLNVRWFVDGNAPASLSGDPERLRQVLTNLMGNAVKFTEEGEVRLDVRVESAPGKVDESGWLLRFTVMDTGIGMEPEACSRIFGAFAQADDSTTRRYGGTGLGLAISRQIVRLMGGDIHVHSRAGEGSTFWFTSRFDDSDAAGGPLPVETPEPLAVHPSSRSLRFLVAEDNTVNQLVIEEQLRMLGHTSVVVSNGREALDALDDEPWDALLLDCQMPVMDGYETAAAIRRMETAGTQRPMWVIAITANAMEGERDTCLRAGMDDFLTKPYEIQQLAGVVARIPPRPGQQGAENTSINLSMLDSLAQSKAANGQNLLVRMIDLFTESTPESLDEIDQSLRNDDLTSAMRAAHKLGGGCSHFGATLLYDLCAAFQKSCKDSDFNAARALAPRIRQEYARVEFAIQRNRPRTPPRHENSPG